LLILIARRYFGDWRRE